MKARMNDQHQDAVPGTVKMLIAWLGTVWGGITLNQAVLWATLLFTVLQIVVLVRDKFIRRGEK